MKQKTVIYYVSMRNGYCMLTRQSANMEEAEQAIYHAEGFNNVQSIRQATQEDIAWVRNMGGYVPDRMEG